MKTRILEKQKRTFAMADLETNLIMHSFLSPKYFTAISTIQSTVCLFQLFISHKAACVFVVSSSTQVL